ncbi:MAG: ubiquitin-like small modifier protein 1 [Syntrophales bacterium]
MKVTIRAYATLREIIGARETTLALSPGETVRCLLENLTQTHPGLRAQLFDATAQVKPYILILKNGRNIMSLQQLDTVIGEGDVIALFPPVAGG